MNRYDIRDRMGRFTKINRDRSGRFTKRDDLIINIDNEINKLNKMVDEFISRMNTPICEHIDCDTEETFLVGRDGILEGKKYTKVVDYKPGVREISKKIQSEINSISKRLKNSFPNYLDAKEEEIKKCKDKALSMKKRKEALKYVMNRYGKINTIK